MTDASTRTAPRPEPSTDPADLAAELGLGVSLAGAEFASEGPQFSNATPGLPGKDYTYNSRDAIRALADLGFRHVRLPFRWERIQPRLGESLRDAEADRLEEAADWAAAAQAPLVLDVHNYARYALAGPNGAVVRIIDEPTGAEPGVTRQHFADLWRRLAERFAEHPGVVAYGLMNEPHDMGASDWKAISQSAVDAIRRVDRLTPIIVAGDSWSHAEGFASHNGPIAWIKDPSERVLYEAHSYFDADRSGKYASSYQREHERDADLATRPARAIADFADWTQANGVAGYMGEFGVPASGDGWLSLLGEFASTAQGRGLAGAYWAAGEWWGDYPLSIHPTDGVARPQQAALASWLGR